MTSYDDVKTRCAVCGLRQRQTVLCSTNSRGIDLDGRPQGMARNVEADFLMRCRRCGYSAYEIKRANPQVREIVQSQEYQNIVKNDKLPPRATTFAAAAHLAEHRNRSVNAGYLFLHAAWYCDDASTESFPTVRDEARRFRRKTASLFASAWKRGIPVQHGSSACHWLLLADILRRAERWEKAETMALRGIQSAEGETIRCLYFELYLIEQRDNSVHGMQESAPWADSFLPANEAWLASVNQRSLNVNVAPLRPSILLKRRSELFQSNKSYRTRAALALAQHAEMNLLVEIFGEAQAKGLSSAEEILTLLTHGRATESLLLSWLDSPDRLQREAAILALGRRLGDNAEARLVEILASETRSETEQKLAFDAIRSYASPSLVERIRPLLRSENEKKRIWAYQIYTRIHTAEATRLVLAGLADLSLQVRNEVVACLMRNTIWEPELRAELHDEVVLALRLILDSEGIDHDGVLRAITHWGTSLPLLALVDHTNPNIRRLAAAQLAEYGYGIPKPTLHNTFVRLLGDIDPAIRLSALKGLNNPQVKLPVDLLLSMLDDPDEAVRGQAALCLCGVEEPRCMEKILTLLEHSSTSTSALVWALALLPDTTPILKKMALGSDLVKAKEAVDCLLRLARFSTKKQTQSESLASLIAIAQARSDAIAQFARTGLRVVCHVALPQHSDLNPNEPLGSPGSAVPSSLPLVNGASNT